MKYLLTILISHTERLAGRNTLVSHLEWLGYVCWCGLMIDYLRVHLSFEICKSNAFVDMVVSKQKHSILKVKTMIVSPIKLRAIS